MFIGKIMLYTKFITYVRFFLVLVPSLLILGCGSSEPEKISDCYTDSMNSKSFLNSCSVQTKDCIQFQKCISKVKHLETNKPDSELIILDYDQASVFFKLKRYGPTTSYEDCNNNRCSKRVDNITNACKAAMYTYSPTVMGQSIFENVPEFSYSQSLALGMKAVNECRCVLYNALKIKDDISIGYCVGEKLIECKTAFCGRNVKRDFNF